MILTNSINILVNTSNCHIYIGIALSLLYMNCILKTLIESTILTNSMNILVNKSNCHIYISIALKVIIDELYSRNIDRIDKVFCCQYWRIV